MNRCCVSITGNWGKVAILNGFFRLLVAGNITKQSYRVKTYNLA